MPSIFTWRPKIPVVRLKRLGGGELSPTRQQQNTGSGAASPVSPSSLQTVPLGDQDDHYIVESAPPTNNRPPAVLTEDEYFYARSNYSGQAGNRQDTDSPPKQRRAVRFSEGAQGKPPPPSPSSAQTPQLPVCNVVPNRAPTVVVDNNEPIVFGRPPLPGFARLNGAGQSRLDEQNHWPQSFPSTTVTHTVVEEFENVQPPRPARAFPQQHQLGKKVPPSNRANVLLQQLRSDDGAHSESDVSMNNDNYSNSSTIRSLPSSNNAGIVFLQFHNEVKRSILPARLHSAEQVKSLFLRCFSNLSLHDLNQPNIRIYIQEPTSKADLFYELEDIRDVKNGSVLKVVERNSDLPPPSLQFIDHLPPQSASAAEYLSEPEFNDYGPNTVRASSVSYRPASVTPAMMGRQTPVGMAQKPPIVRPPSVPASKMLQYRQPSPTYDPYYDPYYASDSSSSQVGGRSGSTTPVQIDSDTRERIYSMERELAGLSSLVHTALITKEMNPKAQREMMELRRQILDLRQSDEAQEDQNNYGHANATNRNNFNANFNRENFNIMLLKRIHEETRSTQTELAQLRKLAEVNAQMGHELIDEAFGRLRQMKSSGRANVAGNTFAISVNGADALTEKLQKGHSEHLASVMNSIKVFELNIEKIRNSVLNSNRKLRMSEVEQLTGELTQIGKNAAKLKTEYPQLQMEIEKEIRRNMESIVKRENYMKQECERIDDCLRRCKVLAGMMVTMKKLAMVQDPTIKYSNKSRVEGTNKRLITKLTGIATAIHNNNSNVSSAVSPTSANSKQIAPLPPLPSSPETKAKSPQNRVISNEKSSSLDAPHVLDSILDELNSSAAEISRTQTLPTPLSSKPKPPERKRYNTAEIRMMYLHGQTIDNAPPPNPIQQSNVDYNGNVDSNTRLAVASSTESMSSVNSANSQEGVKNRARIN